MVLILVVMDDALVQNLFELCDYVQSVLILVVMDDALVLAEMRIRNNQAFGLNPCCNG